jgi:hypothetical protein
MITKTWMAAVGVAGAMVFVSGISQAGTAEPNQRALTRAVTRYLSDHGDLCVGKFTWPRVVTAEDRQNGTSDAVQLPVLERLGLVESTEIVAPAVVTPVATDPTLNSAAHGSLPGTSDATAEPAKRYSLTVKGRRYYLQKTRISLGAHDQPVEHEKDLCVARLSLDKVVKWSPPEQMHGHLETLVRYTYHINFADWMADPEARRVFPIVDRIIRGQGNLLMSVTVQLQDGKWVPVLPGQ